MRKAKEYHVCLHRDGYVLGRKPIYITGTIEELTKYFSNTLDRGKSWENEKGRVKINLHPKRIDSLIKNVNNAMNNSASNGFSGKWLELVVEEEN